MIQNNYSPAFCGIPVHKANIIKIVNEKALPVEVTIEKISKDCPQDFKTVQKIITEWSQKQAKILTQCFYKSFVDSSKNSSHFWLKTSDNDIAGILETTNPETSSCKRIFKIKYLISKPVNCSDNIRYKGAGKTGALQAVKMAKENHFESIRLFSTGQAISFYEKLGFKRNTSSPSLQNLDCYELKSKNFDSFITKNKN